MKNLFVKALFVVALTIAATMQTTAQQSFSYQAVIRNAEGELVTNQKVGLKFSLLNGGKAYYTETQTTDVNEYGNISVEIGKGTQVGDGKFSDVPWNTLDVTLRVEVDPTGGKNYQLLGETKISPAPYALYATQGGGGAIANGASKDNGNLFEVTDREGRPVFAVTNDGIVVYVDDTETGDKARRSGFVVTGRTATKNGDGDLFAVTAEGTQVYVDEQTNGKARRSGFVVTGRTATKSNDGDLFAVNAEGTQVYVADPEESKARRSGFIVTGRTATKDADADIFAVDAATTTVYIDDPDDNWDKARRSGFVVTGRTATKDDPTCYVGVTGSAINLKTEKLTMSSSVPSDDASAPVPVLTITNQMVEMKSDVALQGEILEAEQADFGDNYCGINLEMLFQSEMQVPLKSILKSVGVDDGEMNENFMGQFRGKGHLKYVFADEFLVDADNRDGDILYLDGNGQRIDADNCALSVQISNGNYLSFKTGLTAFDKEHPVQIAICYDSHGTTHTILCEVSLTVDKMIRSYNIVSGTAKYELYWKKTGEGDNPVAVTDIIDYCFTNKGWDNFVGVEVLDRENPIYGNYHYVMRLDNNQNYDEDKYQSKSVDDAYGEWGSGAPSPLEYIKGVPFFSLSGVNASVATYAWSEGASGILSGISGFEIGNAIKASDPEYIKIGNRIGSYKVDVYTYTIVIDTAKTKTYTFYVYEGLVLKITLTETDSDAGTQKQSPILVCTEFKENVAETSFHRWLKNNGVIDYTNDNELNCIIKPSRSFYGFADYDALAHYYVDLNLPSGNLWAANNVGAPSPYDWGDYLAWGDIEEKESYVDGNGYSEKELISSVENPMENSGNINDAAYWWGANLKNNKSDWCMPSRADWQELIDNCFWIWVEGEQGVRVYEAEKPQDRGQSITLNSLEDFDTLQEYLETSYLFLPLSGSYDQTTLSNEMKGLYWASDRPSDKTNAFCLEIGAPNNKQVRENKCYQGLQVRAVAHKNTKFWVKQSVGPVGETHFGTKDDPFPTIEEAAKACSLKFDRLMTFTIMIDGEVSPAVIGDTENNLSAVKQITICGANGLDDKGEPKDSIHYANAATDTATVLKVLSGNVRIQNLKISGGNNKGGGIYVGSMATVTLDDGAVVANNHGYMLENDDKHGLGGGVFVDGQLYMRGTARICNNTAGLASSEPNASYCGYGAGVFVNNGSFVMEGGTISGNKGIGASYNGYYQYSTGKVYYLDFSSGAGVYLNDSGYFVMEGGTISGNTVDIDANTSTIFINSIQAQNANDKVHIEGGGNGVWFEAGMLCYGGYSNFYMSGGAYVDDIYMYCGHEAEPSNGCASGINITDELTTNRIMNISCSDEGNGVGDGAYLLMPYYNPDNSDDGIICRAVSKFNVTHDGYKIVPETVTDNYYFRGVVGKLVESGNK